MANLIEFPLDGGGVIWVEVEEVSSDSGTVRAGRLGDLFKKVQAKVTFDEALNQVCLSTERLIHKLRTISDQPHEIEVIFGFKMNADVGASIAKASSEANYTVTMKWQREESKSPM